MATVSSIRCPRCHHLTIDAWVHQINQQSAYIAKWEDATHPSCWLESLQTERDKYRKIALAPTCECPDQPSLWNA